MESSDDDLGDTIDNVNAQLADAKDGFALFPHLSRCNVRNVPSKAISETIEGLVDGTKGVSYEGNSHLNGNENEDNRRTASSGDRAASSTDLGQQNDTDDEDIAWRRTRPVQRISSSEGDDDAVSQLR